MRGNPVGSFLFCESTKTLPSVQVFAFMQSFDARSTRPQTHDIPLPRGTHRVSTSTATHLICYRYPWISCRTESRQVGRNQRLIRMAAISNLTSKFVGQEELDREYTSSFLSDVRRRSPLTRNTGFRCENSCFRDGAASNTKKTVEYAGP